jgi:hypothetical protein
VDVYGLQFVRCGQLSRAAVASYYYFDTFVGFFITIYNDVGLFVCNYFLPLPLRKQFPFWVSYRKELEFVSRYRPCQVGPCHHGMARPRVADGGTASDMEGSCE